MRVLFISDSPCIGTGNGRVVREISKAFEDPVFGAWFHRGNTQGYSIYPVERGNDETVCEAIQHFKPDRVFLLGDTWNFPNIAAYLKYCPAVIGWFTVCCDCIPYREIQSLMHCSLIIGTSYYGTEVMRRHLLNPIFIPEGVNKEIFYPDGDKQGYLLFVGNNQMRKNPGLALKVAKETGLPLIMKTSYVTLPSGGMADGIDLFATCELLGLDFGHHESGRQVMFITDHMQEHDMRRLYSGATALLHTSGNEGFGLPIVEARACGTKTIGLNYTSTGEILDYAIEPTAFISSPPHCEVASASVDDFVDALSRQVEVTPIPPEYEWPNVAMAIRKVVEEAHPATFFSDYYVGRRGTRHGA